MHAWGGIWIIRRWALLCGETSLSNARISLLSIKGSRFSPFLSLKKILVHINLPPGFDLEQKNGKVCHLKKSLYGLKQSPRAWFDRFTRAIQQHGYKQAQIDQTLFHKTVGKNITILIIYVDDIIVTGNDEAEIGRIKRRLAQDFEMKDLGNLGFFLKMEVARNKNGISISQWKYVLDLLRDTGMM